jgi:transposase-like protein
VKRETRSAAFKKKVAIEALRERKTSSEIATSFGVHPVQVSKWKKQLIDGADGIFESPSKAKSDAQEKSVLEGNLHEKIGRLTMELDWLKKKLDHE